MSRPLFSRKSDHKHTVRGLGAIEEGFVQSDPSELGPTSDIPASGVVAHATAIPLAPRVPRGIEEEFGLGEDFHMDAGNRVAASEAELLKELDSDRPAFGTTSDHPRSSRRSEVSEGDRLSADRSLFDTSTGGGPNRVSGGRDIARAYVAPMTPSPVRAETLDTVSVRVAQRENDFDTVPSLARRRLAEQHLESLPPVDYSQGERKIWVWTISAVAFIGLTLSSAAYFSVTADEEPSALATLPVEPSAALVAPPPSLPVAAPVPVAAAPVVAEVEPAPVTTPAPAAAAPVAEAAPPKPAAAPAERPKASKRSPKAKEFSPESAKLDEVWLN